MALFQRTLLMLMSVEEGMSHESELHIGYFVLRIFFAFDQLNVLTNVCIQLNMKFPNPNIAVFCCHQK